MGKPVLMHADNNQILVICDDGSVFVKTSVGWTQQSSIPGTESDQRRFKLCRYVTKSNIEFEDVTILGVTQRFCWIPSGEFMMGSPEGEDDRGAIDRCDDETQHEVEISEGFWMADTVCTQELWRAIMGNNPSRFKGEDLPVENVSWDDCKVFIDKVNREMPGFGFRLPSEAEWEYACRAGTTSPFYFGENINTEQVNFNGNYPYSGGEKGIFREETVPVKSLPPNGWGIYGMHGNVLEWCEDWYGEYPTGRVVDPQGPEEGGHRVLRGGSWGYIARDVRAAFRDWLTPDLRNYYLGFRLARGPVEQVKDKKDLKSCSDGGRNRRGTTKMIQEIVQFVFIDEMGDIVEIADYENPYRKDGSFLKHIQDKINNWIMEDIDENIGSRNVHILRVKF